MVESKNGGASVMTGVCMITVAQDATGKNTIACLGENASCGRKEILSVDLILSERLVTASCPSMLRAVEQISRTYVFSLSLCLCI